MEKQPRWKVIEGDSHVGEMGYQLRVRLHEGVEVLLFFPADAKTGSVGTFKDYQVQKVL